MRIVAGQKKNTEKEKKNSAQKKEEKTEKVLRSNCKIKNKNILIWFRIHISSIMVKFIKHGQRNTTASSWSQDQNDMFKNAFYICDPQ